MCRCLFTRLCARVKGYWKNSPCLVVIFWVVWTYYTFVRMSVIVPETDAETGALLGVYHLLYIMFIWCLAISWHTVSKKAPPEFQKTKEQWDVLQYEFRHHGVGVTPELNKLKDRLGLLTAPITGMPRYCHVCEQIKPDRCSHCSTCDRCVLKMDHHCPWIANCVGYNNYKAFILLLIYSLLYNVFIVGVFAVKLAIILFNAITNETQVLHWREGEMTSSNQTEALGWISTLTDVEILPFLALIPLGGVAIVLGTILLGFHVNLLIRNKTTLEYNWPPRFSWGTDEDGYNMSVLDNIRSVFGENPLLWAFPIFTSLGDGAHFPVRNKSLLKPASLNFEQPIAAVPTISSIPSSVTLVNSKGERYKESSV